MKKLFAVVLCLAVAAIAVSCVAATAAPSTSSTTPVSEPTSQPATDEDTAPAVPEEPSTMPTPTVHQGDKPIVADASMYRGTVVSATPSTGEDGTPTLVVRLEQAEGSNFGAPVLQFVISNDSRIGFELEELSELEGRYIEVYYSYMTRNAPDPDELYDVIFASTYHEAGMVNFNGVVAEIVPHPEKEGEGSLLMTDLAGGNNSQVFYHYGPETQVYMNFEDIEVGSKLNIFHSPAMALSMPPQCAAWEIRSYYDSTVQ